MRTTARFVCSGSDTEKFTRVAKWGWFEHTRTTSHVTRLRVHFWRWARTPRQLRKFQLLLNAQRRGVLSNSMVQVGPAAWASRRSPVRSVASSASARATYAAS